MKVEQKGTGFTPITITVETKEEANIMWAALNDSGSNLQDQSGKHLQGEYGELGYEMWLTFDNVYPTGW